VIEKLLLNPERVLASSNPGLKLANAFGVIAIKFSTEAITVRR
jgi:hypothetical protein